MPTEVTDPALLAQLNSSKEVTDPALLAQLNGQPVQSQPSYLSRVWDELKGEGELAAHAVTGGVGGLAGGLNYLGTLAATQDPAAAKSVQESTQQALTYQPRTEAGQRDAGVLSNASQYLGAKEGAAAGNWVMDKTGSPLLATGAETLANVPQFLIGTKAASTAKSGLADAIQARAAAREAALPTEATTKSSQLANDGWSMRPSDVAHLTPGKTPSLRGRALESSVGSPEAARDLSVKNAKLAQDKAAVAIGADLTKTGGRFTADTFKALKEPNNKVYAELESLPGEGATPAYADALAAIDTKGMSPEAAAAVDKLKADYAQIGTSQSAVDSVRSLRARATKQIQNDNPDTQERGWAAKNIANAIDDELAQRAQAVDPTLADRFKTARQNLAKINTVEDATRGGIVDPGAILKAKERGVPIHLDPNLNAIADAAENIPHVMRHPSSFANAKSVDVPTSLVDALQGVVRNVGGRAILKGPYQRSLTEALATRSPDQFMPINTNQPVIDALMRARGMQ